MLHENVFLSVIKFNNSNLMHYTTRVSYQNAKICLELIAGPKCPELHGTVY